MTDSSDDDGGNSETCWVYFPTNWDWWNAGRAVQSSHYLDRYYNFPPSVATDGDENASEGISTPTSTQDIIVNDDRSLQNGTEKILNMDCKADVVLATECYSVDAGGPSTPTSTQDMIVNDDPSLQRSLSRQELCHEMEDLHQAPDERTINQQSQISVAESTQMLDHSPLNTPREDGSPVILNVDSDVGSLFGINDQEEETHQCSGNISWNGSPDPIDSSPSSRKYRQGPQDTEIINLASTEFQVDELIKNTYPNQNSTPNFNVSKYNNGRSDDEHSEAFSLASNITNTNDANVNVEPRFSTPSGSDMEDGIKSDDTSLYPFSAMKRRNCQEKRGYSDAIKIKSKSFSREPTFTNNNVRFKEDLRKRISATASANSQDKIPSIFSRLDVGVIYD
ncbi:uncharacterized protein TRIADDRAFT_58491 [Trichoplax adhaerens]|uniref:Uncharacterized protein n=1 Tax=Trichoplax adhaerens TaxID=10228 RepID=B3S2V1_TRIAD|nr:predicted protein [Trichoplax adhaerens]EDV22853.1 predicted protein [Trichoplax adhaerens]|eukprot:XP_002114719.1 predicted protein [Trichoplax adhaerens]